MEDELNFSLDGKTLGNLRVVDLKHELEKRGLSKSGSKKDLVKRLKQQLEFEKLCEERKSTGDCDLKKELDAATEQNEFVQRYLAQQQKIFAEQKEMKRLVELEEIQKQSEVKSCVTSSRDNESQSTDESEAKSDEDEDTDTEICESSMKSKLDKSEVKEDLENELSKKSIDMDSCLKNVQKEDAKNESINKDVKKVDDNNLINSKIDVTIDKISVQKSVNQNINEVCNTEKKSDKIVLVIKSVKNESNLCEKDQLTETKESMVKERNEQNISDSNDVIQNKQIEICVEEKNDTQDETPETAIITKVVETAEYDNIQLSTVILKENQKNITESENMDVKKEDKGNFLLVDDLQQDVLTVKDEINHLKKSCEKNKMQKINKSKLVHEDESHNIEDGALNNSNKMDSNFIKISALAKKDQTVNLEFSKSEIDETSSTSKDASELPTSSSHQSFKKISSPQVQDIDIVSTASSTLDTSLPGASVEEKVHSMDTNVPYPLSDIQLPDSTGDAGKNTSKMANTKDNSLTTHIPSKEIKDNQANSDSEVHRNGVNSVSKSRDKRLSNECESSKEVKKSNSSSKKKSTIGNQENESSSMHNKEGSMHNKEGSMHNKEEALDVEIKHQKRRSSHTSKESSSSSDSENKSDHKVKKSKTDICNSDRESKSSSSSSSSGSSSSGESSHSDDDKKRKTKKMRSLKRTRRRKHSSASSTSSQSSQSHESLPEKTSDRETKHSKTKISSSISETVTSTVEKKLHSTKSSNIIESDICDPPRKKLKINRNFVVIPSTTTELSSVDDKLNKGSSDECIKSTDKISVDESLPKDHEKDLVTPTQEISEPEMGEIIETFPEVKYETRKLNFPGRKLQRASTEKQSSEDPKCKKSKWGKFASSQRTSQTINISTDSLKNWFPDFKLVNEPVSINELMSDDSPPVKDENKKLSFPHVVGEETVSKRLKSSESEKIEESVPVKNSEPSGPVSRIVFIQNLVRPFTLLQLKELLKQTGNLIEEEFWIDKIKSKCFAMYESEEDAIKTKNALNGTRWPPSNPKILVAEFSTEEELELHRSGIDIQKPVLEHVAPLQDVHESKTSQSISDHRKRERESEKRKDRERYRSQAPVREWDKDKVVQESPSREITGKESDGFRSEKKDKKDVKKRSNEDTPAKLLDDLFQKTKSVPCIYWLPLTESQVLEHEEARKLRRVEREKRLQQREQEESEHRNKRPRSDYKSREADSRRSSTRSRSPASRRR